MKTTYYLGDGAYLKVISQYEVVIYTSDGQNEKNQVFLEVPALQYLQQVIKELLTQGEKSA